MLNGRLLIVFILLLSHVSACGNVEKSSQTDTAVKYGSKVLVLSSGSPGYADEVAGHFRQSTSVNTDVSVRSRLPYPAGLETFDLIYMTDAFIRTNRLDSVGLEALRNWLEKGNLVYLEPGHIAEAWLELAGFTDVDDRKPKPAFPVFSAFPAVLEEMKTFFTGIMEHDSSSDRSFYEAKHLPAFVHTKPEPIPWDGMQSLHPGTSTILARSVSGTPLLSWNAVGRGGVLWSADFSARNRDFHGVPVIRSFTLGYPDPEAKNFHYGRTSMDYLFRDLLVDLSAKLRFGLSIRWVYGPNGAPACSWQNHLDGFENWQKQVPLRWARILASKSLVPSYSIRAALIDFENNPAVGNQEEIARNIISFVRRRGIPFNMHIALKPDDSKETERKKITDHLQLMSRVGVPEQEVTGCDHHVFYTHAQPVRQSFQSALDQGFYHDFGGATVSNFDLFPYFFCTSSAYRPYCVPFLLSEPDGTLDPLVIWSPTAACPEKSYNGSGGYFAFAESLRLPVTMYFHPEFIRNANTFDALHPEIMRIIREMTELRDFRGYCPVTEPQTARCILTARYTKLDVSLTRDAIRILADTSRVPEAAGDFRNALGVRIQPAADTRWITNFSTNSQAYYVSPEQHVLELRINPEKPTYIHYASYRTVPFHPERINVPFTLREKDGQFLISISEPGLRWMRYACDVPNLAGYLPEEKNVAVRFLDGRVYCTNYGIKPLQIKLAFYSGPDFEKRWMELKSGKQPGDFFREESQGEPGLDHLDFGCPEARRYFRDGWSIIDEKIAGRSAVWSSGYLHSDLELPLSGSGALSAELDVYPIQQANKGPQTLAIAVNGTVLFRTELKPGWQIIRFTIPESVRITGRNHFRFTFGYTVCPGRETLENKDFRLLSVAFDKIVFHER